MKIITNFFNVYFKIIWLIKDYNKLYLIFFLILLTFITSLTEIITLSTLLPLIDFLINDNKFFNNSFFFSFFSFLGLNLNTITTNYLLFFFGMALIFSYLLKILLLILGSYVTNDINLNLHNRIFSKTINQDYLYFKNSNSSVFFGNLDKAELVRGAIFSLIQLHISSILFFSLFFFVFYVDYFVTIIFSLILLLIYIFVFVIIKNKINNLSILSTTLINTRYKFLLECTNNIKEITIRNLKNFFFKKYENIIILSRKIKINLDLYTNIPAHLITLIISLLILVLIYYFSISEGGLVKSLPILGLFILAAQRMNPPLQNIYNSIVGIKETQYPLYDVLNVLKLNDLQLKEKKLIKKQIHVNSNILIKNFSFSHENKQKYIFKDCNIKLEKNKIYGLYGNSGSGKSTFFDILMGLLKLNKGNIHIDGKEVDIYNNLAWQKNICYVSQESILNDTSIIENIAYGHNIEDIDWKKAKNCAILAEMISWIDSTKDGFNTVIGEKGTKISGGQRQRLFLARAFYSNKQIMLLDEFTNALDFKTEKKILKNLKNKFNNKITLVISHAKKNSFFDHIYKINNQKIELIK